MNIPFQIDRKVVARTALALAASLALVSVSQAQGHGPRGGGHQFHGGHGYHGGGHYAPRGGHYRRGGSGWVWGGLGLGLGLGIASSYNSYPYGYAASPGYVIVDPPVSYAPVTYPPVTYASPQVVYSAPVPAPTRAVAPQPVIYPRNGQSAAQTDSDGDACSQWAGRQPNATADGSVFQRGVAACMDARGYTLR